MRSLPAIASARTLPASTRGFAAVKKVNVACTAPVVKIGVDDEDERRTISNFADQGEVRDRIIGHLYVVKILYVGERIDQKRVAVRLCSPDRGGADETRG
jgi:hypothetical protein